MTRPVTILTGASRGLGAALAEQLAADGHALLCISRRKHPSLAPAADDAVEQWEQDLAQAEAAADRLQAWLSTRSGGAASITLINNAALSPGIAPFTELRSSDIAAAMRVNLEAPMLLTQAFLIATAGWSCPRRVLNISSGLGRHAMAAQAAYCAAKAGLDHFTRALVLEQAQEANGARLCALAPGRVDTEMQQDLRAAAARLPSTGNYAALHRPRELSSAKDTATRILAILQSPTFGHEPLADLLDS